MVRNERSLFLQSEIFYLKKPPIVLVVSSHHQQEVPCDIKIRSRFSCGRTRACPDSIPRLALRIRNSTLEKIRCSDLRNLEQVTGVEPAYAAWEAAVLPVNYTCKFHYSYYITSRCRFQGEIWRLFAPHLVTAFPAKSLNAELCGDALMEKDDFAVILHNAERGFTQTW